MPVVRVQMLPGRTPEQKRLLIAELTRIMVEVAGASPAAVYVLIDEVDPENWGRGGFQMAELTTERVEAASDAGS